MNDTLINIFPGSHFVQLAWVIPDINATEKFFREVMGCGEFQRIENFNAAQYDYLYYGKPAELIDHVSMTYTGSTFIELIQPVSGRSIFHDFLEKNPAGGLQHVAHSVPIAEFDKTIAEWTAKGYPVISSFDTPIAKIFFFDTYKELGVATEIMGITKDGEKAVEQMKGGKM
jgi:methylmalonyl-CoA/ethylmalonyl-CoA epimerase